MISRLDSSTTLFFVSSFIPNGLREGWMLEMVIVSNLILIIYNRNNLTDWNIASNQYYFNILSRNKNRFILLLQKGVLLDTVTHLKVEMIMKENTELI